MLRTNRANFVRHQIDVRIARTYFRSWQRFNRSRWFCREKLNCHFYLAFVLSETATKHFHINTQNFALRKQVPSCLCIACIATQAVISSAKVFLIISYLKKRSKPVCCTYTVCMHSLHTNDACMLVARSKYKTSICLQLHKQQWLTIQLHFSTVIIAIYTHKISPKGSANTGQRPGARPWRNCNQTLRNQGQLFQTWLERLT